MLNLYNYYDKSDDLLDTGIQYRNIWFAINWLKKHPNDNKAKQFLKSVGASEKNIPTFLKYICDQAIDYALDNLHDSMDYHDEFDFDNFKVGYAMDNSKFIINHNDKQIGYLTVIDGQLSGYIDNEISFTISLEKIYDQILTKSNPADIDDTDDIINELQYYFHELIMKIED